LIVLVVAVSLQPRTIAMPPFVTQLRTPAEAIQIAPDGAECITIRVQLLEAWDAVKIVAEPTTTVAVVKTRALAVLAPDVPSPADVVTKLGGFEIRNEAKSLADAGVKDGSTLLLHFRRRQPIK
jgi:hypothetical protein